MPTIIFNGKTYASVEEMPEEVRKLYEKMTGFLGDEDRNGVPDIIEGAGQAVVSASHSIHIVHDGKVYTRLEDLPAEARERYEKAMNMLGDANRNGVPDIIENMGMMTNLLTTSSSSATRPAPAPKPPASDPPVISDATPNTWLLIAVGAVLLLVIGAAVGVFAFQSFFIPR